jgi:hypothetical protein
LLSCYAEVWHLVTPVAKLYMLEPTYLKYRGLFASQVIAQVHQGKAEARSAERLPSSFATVFLPLVRSYLVLLDRGLEASILPDALCGLAGFHARTT